MKRGLWFLFAVIFVAVAGLALRQSVNGAGSASAMHAEAVTLVSIMRSCALTVQHGDTVPPSNARALTNLIKAEMHACFPHPALFDPAQGSTGLRAARLAGRTAMDLELRQITDQQTVLHYDLHPGDDTTGNGSLQATLQGIIDERAFFAAIPRFIRAVAHALHMPPPAI